MAIATAPERSKQMLSFAEYIEQERLSDVKHHFHHGEMIEVAGATYEHNVISANLIGAFIIALDETDCRPLGSDQKIFVSPRHEVSLPLSKIYRNVTFPAVAPSAIDPSTIQE